MKEKIYQKEMLPPDGGWGYAVCIGFTIVFTTCMTFTNSFGIMFNDFLVEQNDSAQKLTTVQGVSGVMISVSGLIVMISVKYFSLRQMALFGSFCYTLSRFLNIFITNVDQLIFTVGVLNGLGWGVIMVASYTIFNEYFVEKRIMMMSICMSVVGIGSIFGPFVTEMWLDLYGFRGVMVMMAAVSLNTFVGCALYQPPEWHLVPKYTLVVLDDNEEKSSISVENGRKTKKPKSKQESLKLILLEKENSKKLENRKFVATSATIGEKNRNTNNKISIKNRIFGTVAESLDLSLFKDLSFCNICLASITGLYGDLQFYLLQPLLLFEYGFTQSEVATCVSVASVTDLASRILLAVFTKYIKVDSRLIYFVSLLVSSISRIIFLQFTDFYGAAFWSAVLGFSRGLLYVPMPLMAADILPRERFAAAYSLNILISGIVIALLSPLSGLLKDYTGSYVATFYMLGACGFISIIAWLIEFCVYKRRKYFN